VNQTKHHRAWLFSYIIIALILALLFLFIHFGIVHLPLSYASSGSKILVTAFLCFLSLIIEKIIEQLLQKKAHRKAAYYNVVRFLRLITLMIIVVIIVSFLNENWYTAAVSLGLISLILGFALQSPIASLIGWFYIVIRAPYKVGERIQVQGFTGDVVEINYFDTTLWEFAGNYMTNDLPSGRLIRFPNSFVWQYEVYNYSWEKFPYIWNEIPFYIGFQSDLQLVEETIRSIAQQELGPAMKEEVAKMRRLVKETPIDDFEIKDFPFVQFRINTNTWAEALLIYLVEPKKSAFVRTLLIKKILIALSKYPEKVMMPKGDSR
jgi:small-conductance mechanosensitive channel